MSLSGEEVRELLSGKISPELGRRVLAEYQAVASLDPAVVELRAAGRAVDEAVAELADGPDDAERVLLALRVAVDERLEKIWGPR